MKIHLFGASASGVTTLGYALAEKLNVSILIATSISGCLLILLLLASEILKNETVLLKLR